MQEEVIDRRRYDLLGECGKSIRSRVYQCLDRKEHSYVALKVIETAFKDAENARKAYREIAYLWSLAGHPNIIRLQNAVASELSVVLTLDSMATDLRRALLAGHLSPERRTEVSQQLFTALAYTHSNRIIHRRIQPCHMLMNDRQQLVLTGFADAIFLGERNHTNQEESMPRLPSHVLESYQPLEAILGSSEDFSTDIWAAGACLIEFETRIPLFTSKKIPEAIKARLQILGGVHNYEISTLSQTEQAFMHNLDPFLKENVYSSSLLQRLERSAADDREYLTTNSTHQHDDMTALETSIHLEISQYHYHQQQESRRAMLCELAQLCLAILPGRRCSAASALLHPYFGQQQYIKISPLRTYSLQANLDTHCFDALHDGGRPWTAEMYRDRLRSFLATTRTERLLPPLANMEQNSLLIRHHKSSGRKSRRHKLGQ